MKVYYTQNYCGLVVRECGDHCVADGVEAHATFQAAKKQCKKRIIQEIEWLEEEIEWLEEDLERLEKMTAKTCPPAR